MIPSVLMTLLIGTFSSPSDLECGTDASTRLRVGQHIMQHAVEDAPADSPIKVEVQGSTVTVSSQAGIRFAARAFGEGATIGLESPQDTSLRMTKDCKNQVYTVNGKSTSYAFTVLGKATSIVVGFHKPWGGFAPGKVYLVTYKFPTEASAPAVADSGYKAAYSDLGLGKCLTKDGKEPAFSYHTGLGPQACQELCDGNSKCGGFTSAFQLHEECFIWLDSGLVGSGDYYGGGHCDVKSRPIPDELARAWAKNAKIAVKSGATPAAGFLGGKKAQTAEKSTEDKQLKDHCNWFGTCSKCKLVNGQTKCKWWRFLQRGPFNCPGAYGQGVSGCSSDDAY